MRYGLLRNLPIMALLTTLLLGPTLAYAQEQAATPAAARSYEVTDLGSLGGDFTEANGINEVGQVVGSSTTAPGQEPYAPGMHAYLWEDGEMIDLGTLGGDLSGAVDINDAGQAVGFAETADGTTRAALWADGEVTDLGTLGGDHSEAIRINEAGHVVGHSTTAPGQELLDQGTHAFLWIEGEMTDLGTLDSDWSRATGINAAGQVVGTSETADGAVHPFLWEDGTMTDLGTLPDFGGGRAIRISEDGLVVGFAVDPLLDAATPTEEPPPDRRAWLYREGELIDLGALGGEFSVALGVNAAEQVVGGAEIAVEPGSSAATPAATGEGVPPPSHAFVWEDGVMTDLNDLVSSGPDLNLETAVANNDAGQIVGVAVVGDQYNLAAGFLLTPVD
jgi:probable HAF family extracellular repeat protein